MVDSFIEIKKGAFRKMGEIVESIYILATLVQALRRRASRFVCSLTRPAYIGTFPQIAMGQRQLGDLCSIYFTYEM